MEHHNVDANHAEESDVTIFILSTIVCSGGILPPFHTEVVCAITCFSNVTDDDVEHFMWHSIDCNNTAFRPRRSTSGAYKAVLYVTD